jgi:hypothetical protein
MDHTIKATPVRGLPPKSKRVAAGRTCSWVECSTVLSAYNPTERCWTHREMKAPRLRGRKTKIDED